jgi:hypothetical protein
LARRLKNAASTCAAVCGIVAGFGRRAKISVNVNCRASVLTAAMPTCVYSGPSMFARCPGLAMSPSWADSALSAWAMFSPKLATTTPERRSRSSVVPVVGDTWPKKL